jgi:hypothetical protein
MPNKKKILSIAPLSYKYAVIKEEDVPRNMKPFQITYKVEDIQKFEVLFFHRLFKKIFGTPSKIQFHIFEPNEKEGAKSKYVGLGVSNQGIFEGTVWDGGTKPKYVGLGEEWTYYFRTDNGMVIEVGTRERHNFIDLFLMIAGNLEEPTQTGTNAARMFINDILKEATRVKGDFQPLNEFQKGEITQHYSLDNIYFQNYSAAEWLFENVEDLEGGIGEKCWEWVPNSPASEHQDKSYDKYFACIGLYYNSIFMYYFMALEGFINLVFHALLKPDLRKTGRQLEERLEKMDIDLKVLLMDHLCRGFRKGVSKESEVYREFAKLKDYRNKIFHSGIVDSLKNVLMIEDGFLYNIDIDRFRRSNDDFPFTRKLFRKEDVLRMKQIIDSLIKEIVEGLEEETQKMVKRYILNDLLVPFWKDSKGQIHLGLFKSDETEK